MTDKSDSKQKARRSGQVIARGDGKWLVRAFIGRGVDGIRRYHSHTVRGTKKDAEKYLRGVLLRMDLGEFAEPDSILCRDFFQRWLTTAVRSRVRRRTFELYEGSVHRYIDPALANHRLRDVKPVDIQTIYSKMAAKGLNTSTVRNLHCVLSNAFKQGVRWGLINQNPMQMVDPPRIGRREMEAMTSLQAREFLKAAADGRFYEALAFLLASGCRPAEAFGLKWTDIDWQKGTVSIVRALYWRHRNLGWEITEPKTSASRRTIPIGPSILAVLSDWRRRQAEEQLRMGSAWQRLGLVFTKSEGQPLDLNSLRIEFKAAVKRAGLSPRLRLYDLRHSCASILMAEGLNPKVVSERLGHTSISLTLSTYSHIAKGLQEAASERLDNALFR